jgi:hypothetical protein
MTATAQLAGAVTGVPLQTAIRMTEGTKEALDGGDARRAIFSEYALKKPKEELTRKEELEKKIEEMRNRSLQDMRNDRQKEIEKKRKEIEKRKQELLKKR